MPSLRTAALLLALAALAIPGEVALAQSVPPVEIDNRAPQATKLAILLVVLVVVLIAGWRLRIGQALRTAAIWLALLVALVALYTYRAPLERAGREMASVLVPGLAVPSGEDVIVRRGYGNAFRLSGAVDGTPVDFIFDTGASMVVLAASDADRAGFATEALDYRIPVMTAAGMTEVAPLLLDEVRVGTIAVPRVRAAVARPGDLEHSLLGMTFLNRLSGYEVRRDRLVLMP